MAYNNSGYTGAPYNFVPLCQNVFERYKSFEELPAHNKIYKSGDFFSGEIEYTFENETDIFVSNGEKENIDFYKNLRGEYAVPGSTMRGLIRNNITVLGFCAAGKDIYDRKFMYRVVGASRSPLKDKYQTQLGIESKSKEVHIRNVKAGYIVKEGEKWMLYGTVDKHTNSDSIFFTIREDYVLKDENIDRFKYIKDNLMYSKYDFQEKNRKTEKK